MAYMHVVGVGSLIDSRASRGRCGGHGEAWLQGFITCEKTSSKKKNSSFPVEALNVVPVFGHTLGIVVGCLGTGSILSAAQLLVVIQHILHCQYIEISTASAQDLGELAP